MKDGEASTTARRVARQRLSFVREAAAYGRPTDDQELQADVAGDTDGSTANAMTRYLQARTGYFDRAVVTSIADGIEQVVVAGAGYDGRSLRYAKEGVRFFELDHPDTQSDKRTRLDRLAIDTTGVTFVAADFAIADIARDLRTAGLDHGLPTLFFCEGVAAYLPQTVLSSLLTSLRQCAAAGSLLAIEIPLVPESPEQQWRRARLGATVAGLGEPLVSSIERGHLADFLLAAGWRIIRATDPSGVDLTQSSPTTAFVMSTPAPALSPTPAH
jgi:methyltransferase (TIGR00027 family)